MKLVVGLGNPGREYEGTRHNMGFWVIDEVAGRLGVAVGHRFLGSLTGQAVWRGTKVVLAKPQLYMNCSGGPVAALLRWYGLDPGSQLLVVHDDVDLPLGKLRIRAGGGAGGHRGVQSIIDETGTNQFPRLRVGVGRPESGRAGPDWVLGKFEGEEAELAGRVASLAAEAVLEVVQGDVTRAMNKYNNILLT